MTRRKWLRRLLADETGMVTVEAAYAIAAIVVMVLIAVGAVAAVTTQIRCTDAAREVARLSAAGDAPGRAVAQRLVGDDARVSISDADDRVVVVEVRSGVAMLPGLTVSARAVAAKEPTGADLVVFAPGLGP